jgi:hypothetical protein
MSATVYQLKPLPASAADSLRRAGGTTYVADAKPGYPCRQCLRDAEVGEALLLVSYDPFVIDSPYRSASPIFIHQSPCVPDDLGSLPKQLTTRQLSVRAFDTKAMMTDAAVIHGVDLDHTLDRMFTDESVNVIHIHNAVRGCWATNAVRSGA